MQEILNAETVNTGANTTYETPLQRRNQMSAVELKQMYGAIDFILNTKKNKVFFRCGSLIGHVSPKLAENLATATLDNIEYLEVSKDGLTWVPCLKTKSTVNILKTL